MQEPEGTRELGRLGEPPIGRRYDLADRRLFLHRSGHGGPAAVFLPGAGAVGLDYLNVHDRVADFTTSVLYDRAGTGWSDPVGLPRTATEVATELHALLRIAEVPAPYVLVAHALGGAYARRFAQLFPDEVAGLVALESFFEDWDDYMPETLHLDKSPTATPGRIQTALLRVLSKPFYKKMFAAWPAEIRTPLVAGHVSPEWMVNGAKERSNLLALRTELHSGGPLPDLPLIALGALAPDPAQRVGFSKNATTELTAGKHRLYTAMTESVTHGEYRELPTAKHSTIQLDAPAEIVRAVRDVIDHAAR
ncbi:alpha/beta fold hydrolase [Nocardia goodfellowii]|uniref:Pimeloyl-ACP methyl ester carboxylesterase n=1 Tax=Nocardia goodfellowii TaxID=882446 RepID=A0ABS4Q6D2_9NOCA|nr:alpha/beta hydrolase [Nocardia goodfellowii]MBP2187249.1 pimeloyl-ACP methyl ester carboxylesterase [Nocardia goodfellowii]